jgi:hypothetical protein
MTARTAQPLPECGDCGRPMRRERHAETGGYCADCRPNLLDYAWHVEAVERLGGPR